MTMSYNETKKLIEIFLDLPTADARRVMTDLLRKNKRTEGEFYAGIVKHQVGLKLTNEQWFELLCRLPNRLLRSQLDLKNLLSERQLQRLPPISG